MRGSLGLRPVARTSLPSFLMYFAKQEEGNMAGARYGPDSNAHGCIPFMPAHWSHQDNRAVGRGALSFVSFFGGNFGPMHVFVVFHSAATQCSNGHRPPNKNPAPPDVFILKAAVMT